MNPISVTTLNTQIKSLLETTFMQVFVSGEISNLVIHSSGHIYFSIKDDNSTISCVMFKGNTKYLKFELENGQKVHRRQASRPGCRRLDPKASGST